MSDCSRCGVTVRFARTQRGVRVKIDNLPTTKGPGRYREVSYNPLIVEPVDPNEDVVAYPAHDCKVPR